MKKKQRWTGVLFLGLLVFSAAGSALAEEALDPALVAKGAALFKQKTCSVCHQDKPKPGVVGPVLNGLYQSTVTLQDGSTVVADEAYIRESIVAPKAKIVKGYQPVMLVQKFTEDEVQALIAYIKSLKGS